MYNGTRYHRRVYLVSCIKNKKTMHSITIDIMMCDNKAIINSYIFFSLYVYAEECYKRLSL